MYLRYQESLKDAENRKPSYLTRKLKPITDDIFSQMPTQDTSYAYDSFCVPDDHISIYEKKKTKKKKKIQQEKFKRIKQLNMTQDQTEMIISSPEQKSFDNFQMTQMPKKKKQISDSYNNEEEDLVMLIESVETKAKHLNENKSLVILDDEDKFVKPIEPKKESEDDEDDEDFNQWLVNETFSAANQSNLTKTQVKNESIQVQNKIFMSHFSKPSNPPPVLVKNEPIKKENTTLNTSEINTTINDVI